jgi:hypothetical protein
MTRVLSASLLGLLFTFSLFADTPPVGFEDPALLDAVLKGKIVAKDLVNTPTEVHTVIKSYFHKVNGDAYLDLAVDYPKYPELFAEIENAKQIAVNADKTEYDCGIDIKMKVGILEKKAYAELHQILTRVPDALSEDKFTQTITNNKDKVVKALQTTRLIPYEGGILVEDDIHFILTKDGAVGGVLKKYLKNLFDRYTLTFRKELKGEPS